MLLERTLDRQRARLNAHVNAHATDDALTLARQDEEQTHASVTIDASVGRALGAKPSVAAVQALVVLLAFAGCGCRGNEF
jgi:hypothetical protein